MNQHATNVVDAGHRDAFTGRHYELIAPTTGRTTEQPVAQPGPGQVLIQVIASGVCASDLSSWSERLPQYPVRLGHEPVGTVHTAGAGVDLQVGTLVTGRVEPAFAEFVVADIRDLVPVPAGIDPEHALGEPLGCVAEALRRSSVRLADRVAVIGLGFMGQCMVQLLARSATARVTAIDLRQDARTLAASLGADDAYHPDELPSFLRAGDGLDLVVEATGSQAGLDLATELVRPHGRVSILGFHQGPRTVDAETWNWKSIDVINAHVRDRDLLRESTRAALDMLAAKRIDLAPLLTHRFRLDQVDDAFAALRAKPDGFVKAVIVNDG